MALDYAAQVSTRDYPAQTRLREFNIDTKALGAMAFIPLFMTAPSPSANSGSVHGTVLDYAEWRETATNDALGAGFKLAYKAEGSSTVVDLTAAVTFAGGTTDAINVLTFAALVADATPGASGFAPVIPDNALVGIVPSVDMSSGSQSVLTLRLATREALG